MTTTTSKQVNFGWRAILLALALAMGAPVVVASPVHADAPDPREPAAATPVGVLPATVRGVKVGTGAVERVGGEQYRIARLQAQRDVRLRRMGNLRGIKYPWHRPPRGMPVQVPELDPSAAASSLALLLGAYAIVSERRRRKGPVVRQAAA